MLKKCFDEHLPAAKDCKNTNSALFWFKKLLAWMHQKKTGVDFPTFVPRLMKHAAKFLMLCEDYQVIKQWGPALKEAAGLTTLPVTCSVFMLMADFDLKSNAAFEIPASLGMDFDKQTNFWACKAGTMTR